MLFNLIRLVVGLAVAYGAYRWAQNYEQRYGERPMKTSPIFWALFCFLLLPIGVIALAVTQIKAGNKWRPTNNTPVSAPPPPSGPAAAFPPPAGWSSGDTILPGK